MTCSDQLQTPMASGSSGIGENLLGVACEARSLGSPETARAAEALRELGVGRDLTCPGVQDRARMKTQAGKTTHFADEESVSTVPFEAGGR